MLVFDERLKSHLYYVDHSSLATFQTCKEKSRLSTVQHLVPNKEYLPFTFGGAYHAGLDALTLSNDLKDAHVAFVNYLKEHSSEMPIDIEGSDRRSVERGINLLSAYYEKWKHEPYEVYKTPNGRPYSEISFRIPLGEYNDIPIILCGTVDKVVRNKELSTLHGFESKTTTMSLTQYITHVRPNMQISIYDYALVHILKIPITDFIWDCTFVSDRKPKEKGGSWERLGIDIDKDFARQRTSRSETDRLELQFDLMHIIKDYLDWYTKKGVQRWPRNGASSGACHLFGGCAYKDICFNNGNEMIIRSSFTTKEWKPWEPKGVSYLVEKRLEGT